LEGDILYINSVKWEALCPSHIRPCLCGNCLSCKK